MARWDDPFRTGFAGAYDPNTVRGLLLQSQRGNNAAKHHLYLMGMYDQFGNALFDPEGVRNGAYDNAINQWAAKKGLSGKLYSGQAAPWNPAWASGAPGTEWDAFFGEQTGTKPPAAAAPPAPQQPPRPPTQGPVTYPQAPGVKVWQQGQSTYVNDGLARTWIVPKALRSVSQVHNDPEHQRETQAAMSGRGGEDLTTAQGLWNMEAILQRDGQTHDQAVANIAGFYLTHGIDPTELLTMGVGPLGKQVYDRVVASLQRFAPGSERMVAGYAQNPTPPPTDVPGAPPAPPGGNQPPGVPPPAGQPPAVPPAAQGGAPGGQGGLTAVQKAVLADDPAMALQIGFRQQGYDLTQPGLMAQFMRRKLLPILEARIAAEGAGGGNYLDSIDQVVNGFAGGMLTPGRNYFSELSQIARRAMADSEGYLNNLTDQTQAMKFYQQMLGLLAGGYNPMIQQALSDTFNRSASDYNLYSFDNEGRGQNISPFLQWLAQSQYKGFLK